MAQEQSGDEASTGSRKSGMPQLTDEEKPVRAERIMQTEGKTMPAGRGMDMNASASDDTSATGHCMRGGFGGSRTSARELSGETLTLTFTDDTSIVKAADREKTALTTDALQVGDTVIVSYDVDTDVVNTIAVLGFTRGTDAAEEATEDTVEATIEEATEETTEATTEVITEATTEETTEETTTEVVTEEPTQVATEETTEA
ncbi:MAG: hypothetical protein LUG13_07065 [Oscillospiraceae bacterium]|nr:hypothetical protein [Oscillospiraceae bacterium]